MTPLDRGPDTHLRPEIEQARVDRLVGRLKAMTLAELSAHCTAVLAEHSGLPLQVVVHHCEHCDQPLPAGTGAAYCGRRCATAAGRARRRQEAAA